MGNENDKIYLNPAVMLDLIRNTSDVIFSNKIPLNVKVLNTMLDVLWGMEKSRGSLRTTTKQGLLSFAFWNGEKNHKFTFKIISCFSEIIFFVIRVVRKKTLNSIPRVFCSRTIIIYWMINFRTKLFSNA